MKRSRIKCKVNNCIEYLTMQLEFTQKFSEKYLQEDNQSKWDAIDETSDLKKYIEMLTELTKALVKAEGEAQVLHGEAKHYEELMAWANIQDFSTMQGEPAILIKP